MQSCYRLPALANAAVSLSPHLVLLFALLTLTRPTYLNEATYLAMAGTIQQHEAYWPADIPRVIHICYKTVEAVPAVVQSKWLSMNPSFKLIVHGDVECYSFLLEHFGAEIAHFYKKMPGQIKGCIFRVFYLYMHGGVYADVDVEPVVSLDHMVQPGEEFVTVGSQSPGLMNPILIIARRHEPVLLATMHAFIVRYRGLQSTSTLIGALADSCTRGWPHGLRRIRSRVQSGGLAFVEERSALHGTRA